MTKPASQPAFTPGATFPPMLTGHRVLVVEDEPSMAQALCAAIVSRKGQPFGPVTDIWQALEFLARERIDAAIVDFDLRAGDAAALAHALADGGKAVLIYTARDLAERVFEEAKLVRVCRKPIAALAAVDALSALLTPSRDVRSRPPRGVR